jgi:hypothetical protein
MIFWRVTSTGTAGRTSAVWELTIPARDSGRQGSWGSLPDFNGDGFGDLVVGVQASGVPTPNQLRVFPGGPQGPASTPTQTLTGDMFSAQEAGSAGDLDGDGFADLVVWNSPQLGLAQPQTATVTVYRGGPQGLSSPVTFNGPDALFGNPTRVLSAGDVNGDGYGDLLVGGATVAELFLGGPTGVSTTPAEMLPPLPTPTPDAHLPIGNADFNGDGFPDAIIAGQGTNGMLYEGDGHTLVAHPEVSLVAEITFGGLAGDVNGDGFADVASYAVYTGSPNGPVFFESLAGQYFYQGAGDVNGDGFSDVLNMVSTIVGVREPERVYFGGPNPCTSNACPTFAPLFPFGDNGGSPEIANGAKGIGDVNGDGFADFVYFAPGLGQVSLFLGSAAGPPSSPSMTFTGEQGFGFSVAGM